MKKTKIIYWTTTILFAGFMLFSAMPDLLMLPDAVAFIGALGYPKYFVSFIGFAKVLGCIAILVPQFRLIKEWAYAGLFFDLIGAVYSMLMVHGYDNGMLTMVLVFAAGITSYIYSHKVREATSALQGEKVAVKKVIS